MKPGLTGWQLFVMSFGAIVGVGWITILGHWLALAGPGGSVVALLLGALAMLLVANSYGFLAERDLLSRGGEIQAATVSIGPTAGFLVTAALALDLVAIVAFEALSAGWILVTLFPALEGPVVYTAFGHEVRAGAMAVATLGTAAIALLNLRPVTRTANSQNAVVLLKIAVTAVFCIAGLLKGQAHNLLPLLPAPAEGRSTIGGILALAATMPLWYAGFNVVAQLAGERDATVRPAVIGRVMRLSILAACAFYVGIVLAAACVTPWQGLIEAPLPAATAFRIGLSSPLLANLVLVSGLLGIVSAWIACFAAATRVLDMLWRQVRPSTDVDRGAGGAPGRAGRVTLVIFAVAGLLSLAGRGALVPIVNVAALCCSLVYLTMCLVAHRNATRKRERAGALAGACVAAFLACYGAFSIVDESGWAAPEVAISSLWACLVAGFWFFRLRFTRTG